MISRLRQMSYEESEWNGWLGVNGEKIYLRLIKIKVDKCIKTIRLMKFKCPKMNIGRLRIPYNQICIVVWVIVRRCGMEIWCSNTNKKSFREFKEKFYSPYPIPTVLQARPSCELNLYIYQLCQTPFQQFCRIRLASTRKLINNVIIDCINKKTIQRL